MYLTVYDKHCTPNSLYAPLARVCNTWIVKHRLEIQGSTLTEAGQYLQKSGYMIFKLNIQKCRSKKSNFQFGSINLL